MIRTNSSNWKAALCAGLALSLMGAGCGGGGTRAETPDPTTGDRSADELGLASAHDGHDVQAGDAMPASAPPVLVVAGDHTPIPGAVPTLRITAPTADQLIRTGNVTVRLDVRNWPLEAPQGPHLHLILDNEPYIAIRDVSRPLDLNALVRENLGHELGEGTHVLRMFPSRGHHESVKEDGAFGVVVFHYRSRTPDFAFDPTAPLLTFSRPKGCNVAGHRLLVDFYLSNTTIGVDGNRVRWTVDDASGDITSWTPHWVENLAPGQHSISLELRDAEGQPIPGMFNRTERTFTVAETCPG